MAIKSSERSASIKGLPTSDEPVGMSMGDCLNCSLVQAGPVHGGRQVVLSCVRKLVSRSGHEAAAAFHDFCCTSSSGSEFLAQQ